MIRSITSWMIASRYVNEEDREVIEYGLIQGIYSLLGILGTICFGGILNIFLESIIFIITLIPLRMYAGGYHADSRKKCIVISIILTIIALYGIRYWNISEVYSLWSGMIAAGVLFFLIPVEGTTRLDDIEKAMYRRKGRLILILEMLVFILTLNWSNIAFYKAIMFTFLVVLLLVLGGLAKGLQNSIQCKLD